MWDVEGIRLWGFVAFSGVWDIGLRFIYLLELKDLGLSSIIPVFFVGGFVLLFFRLFSFSLRVGGAAVGLVTWDVSQDSQSENRCQDRVEMSGIDGIRRWLGFDAA